MVFSTPGNPNSFDLLSGVASAARHFGWKLLFVRKRSRNATRKLLHALDPLGCIVDGGINGGRDALDPAVLDDLPCVYITPNPKDRERPMSAVNLDSHEIGRLAAKELLTLPLASFAYLPWPRRTRWCEDRRAAFCEAVAAAGRKAAVFSSRSRDELSRQREFRRFLNRLPRPIGIFAANDQMAWNACHAAQNAGYAVPADVAIIGVDNIRALCENAVPRLSSIVIDFIHGGYLAGELLNDLITGKVPEPTQRLFHPSTVVRRESTVFSAPDNPDIQPALDLIREKACEGLMAREVAALIGGSRRHAERRFREETGQTILEAINAVRLEKVKELLRQRTTDISMIADLCGWTSAGYLRRFFRQRTGQSLSAWRTSSAGTPSM